jgi:hypothetical protein
MVGIDKSNLGFLGEDFQFKLVHEFMEDKDCFKDLNSIVDQNMFTDPYLKIYVGEMKNYFDKYETVPSYGAMETELRSRARTKIEQDTYLGILDKIRNTPSDGAEQTRVLAMRFFRQQNIIKAANQILKIAGNGDVEHYDKCEELLKDALNKGEHNDYEEVTPLENLEETLSEDFRITIPTGIGKIDETLEGGLGKGELGVIVGPSSFGKTSLTTAMAAYAATYKCTANGNNGFKVLQIVFEDRTKQIQRKHIAAITGVEAKNLSKPEYIDNVKELLRNYGNEKMLQANLRIIRVASGEKTASDIELIIKKHINEGFRPDLTIVDYFECIKLKGDSTMSKYDKEALTMRKFETISADYNMGIWVPVQGNRDSINAQLVTMDQAGGAIQKIQIAHIILSISRTIEDISDNIATLSILKNRAGSAGKIFQGVEFNNGTCRINTDKVSEYSNLIEFGKQQENVKMEVQREVFNMTK